MVQEYSHGHESSTTRAHLNIKQEDALVLRYIVGELVVVKLGLAGAKVGLNEHAAGLTIRDDALQASLQTRPTAENDHGRELARGLKAVIRSSRDRRLDFTGLEAHADIGGLLNKHYRESVEVEDELFAIELGIQEKGVDTADLVSVLDELDVLRERCVFADLTESLKLHLMCS